MRDAGWSLGWVVGGTSIGLLVAGLISPRVGKIIDRHGGRPVLAASSVLFAAGLAIIGLAPVLPVYLLGWVLVGAAMGAGLYDAAFAALGQLYGRDARGPITNLTLFGGFASTVCWPLSAYLEQAFGWRGACFAYAGLHLCLALPLQLVMPRAKPKREELHPSADHAAGGATRIPHEMLILCLIALVMTLAAGIGSIVVVHLLVFLQARGADFALAVSLGTLFGPAQVGARVVERLFGQHYHPIWTMIASCLLMAAGLVLLLVGFPLLAIVDSGLRRRLRHLVDRARHAAARTVRSRALSRPDGPPRLPQPDRAGARAERRRVPAGRLRRRYDDCGADGLRARQCRGDRRALERVPGEPVASVTRVKLRRCAMNLLPAFPTNATF